MTGSITNAIIDVIYGSLLSTYQESPVEKLNGSDFVCAFVGQLLYVCHEKAMITTQNDDEKCFQYAIPVAINY